MVKRHRAILASLQKIAASNSNQVDSAAGLYHKISLENLYLSLFSSSGFVYNAWIK